MSFTKVRWPAVGPMLVLAGSLCWSNCEALDQGASLNVMVMLSPPIYCNTNLLDYSLSLALSTCQASNFQLSAIHPSWKQTTISDTAQAQQAEPLLVLGLLGSSLKQWALVHANWAWKSNKLSQEISHYELRVDY